MHSKITLVKPSKDINTIISLPGSKSESNRALIIQALCENPFNIFNISTAEDTVILAQHLHSANKIVDCGHAGTTFRFLTAFYAIQEGLQKVLTGSARMKERPIEPLVDALRSLGADIDYLEKQGHAPLLIKGKKIAGGSLTIDASISSQFISALLLIAPILRNGLKITLKNLPVSTSYIDMTLSIMHHFGITYSREENTISVPHQSYKSKDILIESDWSSASYWYSIVALNKQANILLKGLKKDSLQGDYAISELMSTLGVHSQFSNDGVLLTKIAEKTNKLLFDFIDCPDLAQTVITCCAGLEYEATFTGLKTLRIKETDRIKALQNELKKIGFALEENCGTYLLKRIYSEKADNIIIQTYQDHRMAMSFAPLALIYSKIDIENPEIVKKSYPEFWNALHRAGFKIID